jgi:hypothetical protein
MGRRFRSKYATARLFKLAREARPTLEDPLDKLDEIDTAGNGLPKEGRDPKKGKPQLNTKPEYLGKLVRLARIELAASCSAGKRSIR